MFGRITHRCMIRLAAGVFLLIALLCHGNGTACIGRTLTIGIVNAPNQHFLAELVSLLVNERTGTVVTIVPFETSGELYSAVSKGNVGLMIENVPNGMAVIGRSDEISPKAAYELVKTEYGSRLNLVWLEQFGDAGAYAPVVAVDVLEKMPVLPKLVDKLAGILHGDAGKTLMERSTKSTDLHKLAHDFLKLKKLI